MRFILKTISNLLLVTLFAGSSLFAQQQNSKWFLGNGAALDFSGGSPVSIAGNAAFVVVEGLCAVSDKTTGALLFYSDGLKVYNTANNVMPNGSGLLAGVNSSSTQGALIVPKPGNPDQYYLFTSDETYDVTSKNVYYSIIDMTLNAGLGDVVAGQKNILLVQNSTERLALAMKPDSNSFWLMTHDRNSNIFKAFEITTAGVNTTPVNSAVGLPHVATGFDDDAIGCIKFNPQNNKLAVALYQSQRLQILDFNNCTGVVSNPITIVTADRPYGVEFSPDGSRLYYTLADLGIIFQINMQAGSNAAIAASSLYIDATSSINQSFGALQLGPDNKIYAATLAENWISCINNPNVLGTGCNYVDIAVLFSSGVCYFGLPQYVPLINANPASSYNIIVNDSCFPNGSQFSLPNIPNVQSVTWDFGDPSTGVNNTSSLSTALHNFSTVGPYIITANITTNCGIQIISMQLNIVSCNAVNGITGIKINGDTCTAGTPIALQAEGTSNSPYFSWNFGDPLSGINNTVTITGASNPPFPTHTFSGAGSYNVCVSFQEPGFPVSTVCRTITIGQCNNVCSASITGTTIICTSGTATLTANTGSSYLWSTGATTQTITTTTPGNYTVTVTSSTGCVASAAVVVTVSALASPNISTAINLSSFCFATLTGNSNVPGAIYTWTGPGTPPITVNPLTIIYPGTYILTVLNPANGCSNSGQVSGGFPGSALITASNDVSICPGGSAILTASGGSNYTWSPATGLSSTTGSTVTASPAVTTIYVVTNTTALGCQSTDTVKVTVAAGAPASITGVLSFCSGGNTTLTASAGTAYLWSTGATTQSINVNAAGNYTVTVTQGGSCPTSSATVTVLQNPLPNVSASVSYTFPGCTGVMTGTSTTPGVTFEWTGPATPPNSINPVVVIYAGVYTLTVTDPSTGCVNQTNLNVVFPAGPGPVITANDASICPGGSATLTATGSSGNYTWLPVAGLNIATGSTVIASPPVTTLYIVSTYVSPCFSYDSVTVTVVNNIPASISGNLSFCTGGSTTLTANPGTAYLWSNGATTQSITVNTPGIYTVTVTQGGTCPNSSATVNVTLNNATANISGNLSFCNAGSTTLTANAGSSYLWSTGATTQSITVNTGANYSVTVTQANSCSATTNVNVTSSTPTLSPIYHD